MKKLLSLLGALGMLASTSSTVVACNQKVKKVSEDNRTLLRVAITNNSLGLIKTDLQLEIIEAVEEEQTPNLAPYILERLVELNGGSEAIEFDLLDLTVAQPTLINKFGDMKTTITVLDRSLTHTGSVDVYFSLAIGNEHLIRQTNLGIFDTGQEEIPNLFDFENDMVKMKPKTVKNQIIIANPHLAENRFAEQIMIDETSYLWNKANHTGSVKVSLADYPGVVTISYQVLLLLNRDDYKLRLGYIVIGSPNNPEIANDLTDWHLVKAFFKANPKLVGVLSPADLTFEINDGWWGAKMTIAGFSGSLDLSFSIERVPQNIVTDLGEIWMDDDYKQHSLNLMNGWKFRNQHLPSAFVRSIKGTSMKTHDETEAEIFLVFYGEIITYKVTFKMIPNPTNKTTNTF